MHFSQRRKRQRRPAVFLTLNSILKLKKIKPARRYKSSSKCFKFQFVTTNNLLKYFQAPTKKQKQSPTGLTSGEDDEKLELKLKRKARNKKV